MVLWAGESWRCRQSKLRGEGIAFHSSIARVVALQVSLTELSSGALDTFSKKKTKTRREIMA